MVFTNGWRSKNKQGDKFILKLRLGLVTLFDFYYDRTKKQIGFMLLNFGVKNKDKKQAS